MPKLANELLNLCPMRPQTSTGRSPVLNLINLQQKPLTTSELRRTLPRGGVDVDAVLPTVTPVVTAIRDHGVSAALDYGEQFDHVRPESLQVPSTVIDQAVADLDPDLRAALEESIARVRAVHADQKPQPHTTELTAGGTVTEIFQPIARVGLYVPGGNAVYPSIRAACGLLGVTEVWAVGGAQAVALMAYGDTNLEPVDMITGPGNIYVTAAKRLVRGVVGIDSEAGPTEIAILADDTADPVWVAYDLISQAEHDTMAASVLITPSTTLAEAVNREVAARYRVTRNADRVAQALTGSQSGIVLVDDLNAAITVANAYAAEHLEIHTINARAVAAHITNAGAIFVGGFSPVPLGDYSAGSNHVLPTSGTARFSAGLSTHTFLRPVNLIEYDEPALKEISTTVITFADAEDLPAHGEAIRARFEDLA